MSIVIKDLPSQTGHQMAIILIFRRDRQEDCKVRVCLGYIERSCLERREEEEREKEGRRGGRGGGGGGGRREEKRKTDIYISCLT